MVLCVAELANTVIVCREGVLDIKSYTSTLDGLFHISMSYMDLMQSIRSIKVELVYVYNISVQ